MSLVLRPPADLPLGPYSGVIGVNAAGTAVGVPFQFNCISDAVGDVRITVVDEETYHGDGTGVEGAAVTLRDPVTGLGLATGRTDGPVALVHFNQLWANVSHRDLHRLTISGPPKPPF